MSFENENHLRREICNAQMAEMDQRTIASKAGPYFAEQLGVSAGDPILLAKRVIYDFNRAPVEISGPNARAIDSDIISTPREKTCP